jgi:hypothetical protein
MTWPVIVLVVLATGLATAGAVVACGEPHATEEAGARHAIVGLGLLAVAAAVAAVGGAMLGAGGTGTEQVGAFAGAAATVALPLFAVGLARRTRRARRSSEARRSRLSG